MVYGIGYGVIFMGFMIFGLLLFFIPVIVGVFFIIRHYMKSNAKEGSHSSDDALSILHERYARGEIDEEEYNQKKAELRKF